jgi:hypothetical protein
LLADCARSTHASNAAQTDGVHKEEAMKTFLKVTIATLMLVLASLSWAQDCTNATI